MSAREQVATTAAANGWTLTTPSEWDRVMCVDEYRRRSSYVRVQFSVRGAVVQASSNNRTISGTGKLAQITACLGK